MKIGAMNDPRRDPVAEMHWLHEAGLEFIDLTLEPPEAAHWRVDVARLRSALRETGLGVVGHTAYYLPLASPFEELRRAAVRELQGCMTVFAELGTRLVNVHPDRYAPQHDRRFYIQRNRESLAELLLTARGLGLKLMLENLPGDFNTAAQLAELLEPFPDLGLHLDIGHANLMVRENTTEELLRAYGPRLVHVHLHDNKGGGEDLHLPLGAGTLALERCLRALRESRYDGTITLEVFAPDRRYLLASRDLLRAHWAALDPARSAAPR